MRIIGIARAFGRPGVAADDVLVAGIVEFVQFLDAAALAMGAPDIRSSLATCRLDR